MLRLVASVLIGLAAFDVALPSMDRLGTAALGVSVAVLAIPRRSRRPVALAPDVLGDLGELRASPLAASVARVLGSEPLEPSRPGKAEGSSTIERARPLDAA